MRLVAFALVALALTAGAAPAAPRPGDWVWDETAKALNEAADRDLRDPADASRAPDSWGTPTARMFSRIDVNHDGVDDWRVDYQYAPNPSLWCGTGGCRNEIWVSEPGHHHERFMEVGVRQFKLSRRGGVTRLDLEFHGSMCGGYGVQECRRSYVWTEGGFEPAATPKGGVWLYGGPAMLVPPRLYDMPESAGAAVERLQMQCGVNDGRFDPTWQVQSIPDLDGDGYNDWVIGGPYASCEYGEEHAGNASPPLPTQVFVTGGDPRRGQLAYEGQSLSWGLDIGTEPATFYAIPEGGPACEYEKPCGRRLGWDAASGKLVDQE